MVIFGDVNVSVNGNFEILKCMFALNGTSLGTNIIIILISIVYCYFIFDFHPRKFVKKMQPLTLPW